MKIETVTIHVERFENESGPTCIGCKFNHYKFSSCMLSDDENEPGASCPVWHDTVKPKWATFGHWWKSVKDTPFGVHLIKIAWDEARK